MPEDFKQPETGRLLHGVPLEIDRAHHNLEQYLEHFAKTYTELVATITFIRSHHRLPSNAGEIEMFAHARARMPLFRKLADDLPIQFQNIEAQFAKIKDDESLRSKELREKNSEITICFEHSIQEIARVSTQLIYNWIGIIRAINEYPWGVEDELKTLVRLTEHDRSITNETRQQVIAALQELRAKITPIPTLYVATPMTVPLACNDDGLRILPPIVIED